MTKDVTVIVPVWNSKDYLDECLSSIDQKYATCVVIDDCSTDGSVDIAKKYGVHIIKKTRRSGAGDSKNIGLKYLKDVLKTPYVMFLDSDDYYSKDAIPKMIEAIQGHSLAVCNTRSFGGEREYGRLQLNGTHILTSETSQKTPCVAWDKIYRTKDIDGLYFSRWTPDDNPFWFTYCCKNYGVKVNYIDENLCNYRQNSSGVYQTQERGENPFYDSIQASFVIYDWLIKNQKKEFIPWYVDSYYYRMIEHYAKRKNVNIEVAEKYALEESNKRRFNPENFKKN